MNDLALHGLMGGVGGGTTFKPFNYQGDVSMTAAYASGAVVRDPVSNKVYRSKQATSAGQGVGRNLPSYVGSWVFNSNTSGTALTITVPAASVQVGDVMILTWASNNSMSGVEPPAGWTKIAVTGYTYAFGVAYRIATSADATSGLTVTPNASGGYPAGMIRAYRNVSVSIDDFIWWGDSYSSGTPTYVTTSDANTRSTSNNYTGTSGSPAVVSGNGAEFRIEMTFTWGYVAVTSTTLVTASPTDTGLSNLIHAEGNNALSRSFLSAWDKVPSSKDWTGSGYAVTNNNSYGIYLGMGKVNLSGDPTIIWDAAVWQEVSWADLLPAPDLGNVATLDGASSYKMGDVARDPANGRVYQAVADLTAGSHYLAPIQPSLVWSGMNGQTSTTSAANVTVTIPAGTLQVGDLIMATANQHSSVTTSPFTGFTWWSNLTDSYSGYAISTSYKVATAADVTNGITLTASVYYYGDVGAMVFRNLNVQTSVTPMTAASTTSLYSQPAQAKTGGPTGKHYEYVVAGGTRASASASGSPLTDGAAALYEVASASSGYGNLRLALYPSTNPTSFMPHAWNNGGVSTYWSIIQYVLAPTANVREGSVDPLKWREVATFTQILNQQSGGLLAYTEYGQSASSSSIAVSTSATVLPLSVSFEAPPSGVVVIRMSATAMGYSGGYPLYWYLVDGAGANVTGSERIATSINNLEHREVSIRLAGLTPGITYSYVWYARSTQSTAYLYHGGTEFSGSNTYGPLTMEVWAA